MKKEMTKGEVVMLMNIMRSVKDFKGLSKDGRMSFVENMIALGEVEEKVNKTLSKHMDLLRTDELMSLAAEVQQLREREQAGETLTEEEKGKMFEFEKTEAMANIQYNEIVSRVYSEKVQAILFPITRDDFMNLMDSDANAGITPEGYAAAAKYLISK